MIYANVYAENRTNNSIFANKDLIHKFNPTYFPQLLRDGFLSSGVEINTPDLNIGKEIAFNLYIEGQNFTDSDKPEFLLALENPYINNLNQDISYCTKFTQVFSWDARLFSLPNVIPIQIPHHLNVEAFTPFSERHIFSCLINANKAFKKPLPSDLYLERLETIKWYEKNALDHFHLYGLGWDKLTPAYTVMGKLKRIFPRLKSKIFGHKAYPSFHGEVSDKTSILAFSKYSYCYENSLDLTNYVTEKIFDSLVCGCVPIYWGSDNVASLIPSDCFIDRRQFKNTEEVHAYLRMLCITRVNPDSARQLKPVDST